MKRTILLTILAALFFISAGFAQTTDANNTTLGNTATGNERPGVPTSTNNETIPEPSNETPQFSSNTDVTVEANGGVGIALDRIRYLMTRNDSKKVAIGLRIAEARLAQLNEAHEKGDIKRIEKAKQRHDKEIAKIKSRIENLGNNSSEFKHIGKQVEKYDLKIREASRQIDIKVRARNMTPEERAKIQALISDLKNGTEDVKARIQFREGELRVKIIERQNDNKSEIRERIEERREEIREKIQEKRENRTNSSNSTNKTI